MKGLRFGTRSNTYLEFYRQLKVKRRSEFSIEFKTSHRNGIIFYVANSRNVDFIALYMKNGRVSNCLFHIPISSMSYFTMNNAPFQIDRHFFCRSFMDLTVDLELLSFNLIDDTTMDNGMQPCLVELESTCKISFSSSTI